jgi:hypothetical protein
VGVPQKRPEKGLVDIAQPLNAKARTIMEDRILTEDRKVIGDPMP